MNFYFTHLFKLIIMLNLRNENIPIIYLIIIGNQIMETHHEKEKVEAYVKRYKNSFNGIVPEIWELEFPFVSKKTSIKQWK